MTDHQTVPCREYCQICGMDITYTHYAFWCLGCRLYYLKMRKP